jgi:nitrogen regulatory protein P-II 1
MRLGKMKKIEAIIREERLELVRNACEKHGYCGMTVTEVSGRGKQRGVTLQWRVGEYHIDFLPKIKLEVVVLDDDVPKLVNAITVAARTGEEGDGKIFIIPLDNAVRVRTGEDGDRAV